MKNYEMNALRNIAFIGSSGAGKTSLIEQMLYVAKMTNRLGKITDGNTVMDYDPDEIEKNISLGMAIGYADWKNKRINIIDTPGYGDFIGDQIAATTAADTVAIIANAVGGFEVGLEKSLEILENRKSAKAIIVNKMDSEHADFFKVLDSIKENTGIHIAPVMVPMGKEATFKGVIDVIKGKAIIDGKLADVPAEFADELEEAKMALMEAVAETNEELLEKFLDTMELSNDELANGLKSALANANIVPAFCCSASTGYGVDALMDAIIEYFPSPEDKKEMTFSENGQAKQIICSPSGDLLAYAFKSVVDPNMGEVAFVRIYSGTLKSGMDIFIPERDQKDKVSSMYFFQGKNRADASELKAGEIGGLVKLKVARGLNSIVAVNSKLSYQKIELPSAVYWQSIRAANQSDEDKIGQALSKLLAEDPTVQANINTETHENVLSAMGEQQVALIQKRLKSRYKVDALLKAPKIPYKETIMGKADTKYRHKKQSGGKGQYGEVYFRVAPTGRGEGYQFINSIVGGVIPGNFIPAIEKGIAETMEKGIIAGYPVVDISVDCYFGSYHDVDSSEMAFKIASSMCLKDGFSQAKPILLEPIHEVDIIIPTEYMGDVMGDISTRRGKINGMEQDGKKQILKANVPLSELFAYFPTLKSLTQGRGMFTQKFSHFEKVPDEIAKTVIEAFKKEEE
ncbi:MAG TPA: elongation factor G [Candidatus Cloacimonadota bacterium]|nr:elongation factor G [Candidatus Cloacimonadota bacterium]HPY96540.1 elongation factor G [Candidatus Cloacimonadota bacterium]HQB40621.1 elongation factor G [Candidatus Cloacimonadota bacterium]